MFFGIAILAALLLVLVTRGSFRQLTRLQIQAPWFLFLAVAIQVVLEFAPLSKDRMDDVGLGLLLFSYALLLSFCFVNLGVRGMFVVAVGIGCNAVAIGLNQGMPAKVPEGEKVERTVKHRPERDTDLLPFLGDIIVLPSPIDESISFGDLILAVGLVDVLFWAGRRKRRRGAELEDEVGAEPVPEPDASKPASEPEPVAAAPAAQRTEDDDAVIDLGAYELRAEARGALRRSVAARDAQRRPTLAQLLSRARADEPLA